MNIRLAIPVFSAVFWLLSGSSIASAVTMELEVSVGDQELSIVRYPARGEHLIIWIAPGYGSHERAFAMSKSLAARGVEIWHVDLADSLFLTKNTSTMRSLDGRYVAGLIEAAHESTGKSITLLTRSYGALPLLKGVRWWQLRHAQDQADYLSGAILFSPELYSTVPALGLEAVYSPITAATNIPIMIYQAGKRSNRWQLDTLLQHLRNGGASVYVRIKAGVIGIFYKGDTSPATMKMINLLPDELVSDLSLLRRIPTPRQAMDLPQGGQEKGHGLDNTLKRFSGRLEPLPLDLVTAAGLRIKRDNYAGKVTVVNFWASWCPPCVEEIPSLNKLRKLMRGKPFELISVNYAETKQVVKDFLKRVNVDFPVLLDEDGKVAASWNVLVYPSTFVIGPDGEIKYGVNGAIHWDSPDVVKALSDLVISAP